MMTVGVYGKKACGLCEAAKEKLQLLGISFKEYEIAETLQWHEGWRDDDSVEVQACHSDIDALPVITVNRKAMSYPQAMKLLKSLMPSKPLAQPKPAEVFTLQPVRVEQELVAAFA